MGETRESVFGRMLTKANIVAKKHYGKLEPEDIAASAMLSVLEAEKKGELQITPEKAEAIAAKTTHWRGLDHVRGSKRRPGESYERIVENGHEFEEGCVVNPEHIYLQKESTEALMRNIGRLPKPQAQMLEAELMELNGKETMEQYGVSVGEMKSRKNRAFVNYRNKFTPDGEQKEQKSSKKRGKLF